ncbi:polysaccharide deacetylase family protein [Sporosarcina gallistercoris]|uniref:Polysaccharide deacetylase n=1 Tax=Sporosarcina gallistercoris TaxID=2762245 RepID=A0ABR8PIS6_9BACL|nr:polysaccharide deacetylase family protein [Sporosarcina gallistercoris]MBD7908061.1 polysaccharide deacetylase [Sporosarcina gallistercoris]
MSALDQQESRKRKRLKKRYFVILLLVLFGTGFFIGKSYSARELPSTPDKLTNTHESDDKTEESSHKPVEATKEEQANEETVVEEKIPKKVVYLTFDDGPSKLTEQFLDILQEHGVKATFFMQGSNLKKEHLQNSVKRAAQEGHYIGAHSMTHNFKKLYTDQQFVPEMIETLNLVHEITGLNPHLVRPPYGSAPGLKSDLMRKKLADAHIKVWDWTIDSNDWELAGKPSQILQNIKQGATSDREIVLMHEKPQTLAALPGILNFFKEQEYEFAVYDEAHHFVLNFQNDSNL